MWITWECKNKLSYTKYINCSDVEICFNDNDKRMVIDLHNGYYMIEFESEDIYENVKWSFYYDCQKRIFLALGLVKDSTWIEYE